MSLKIMSLLIGSAVIASAAPAATTANLQTAFSGESNARTRYLAFAEKADSEGYAGVASLFRAAARAEQVHAANHAAVIEKLGGIPEANIAPPAVNSTRENLEVALKGERYEHDEMYPAFIQQAEADGVVNATRTFQLALSAEGEHARLYADALANLEKLTARRAFYVCPVCGFTTLNGESDPCPVCGTPKERFEQVS